MRGPELETLTQALPGLRWTWRRAGQLAEGRPAPPLADVEILATAEVQAEGGWKVGVSLRRGDAFGQHSYEVQGWGRGQDPGEALGQVVTSCQLWADAAAALLADLERPGGRA